LLNWVEKARAKLASKSKKSGKEKSEEDGARRDPWRRGMFVASGANVAGSRRAASGGRDGIQAQQGFPTDRPE